MDQRERDVRNRTNTVHWIDRWTRERDVRNRTNTVHWIDRWTRAGYRCVL